MSRTRRDVVRGRRRARSRSVGVLSRPNLRLVVPALVVAEATYFVGRRLGAPAESAFLRGLAALDVEGPSSEDFVRMAELVERYADFPLGGTDASVIALAERLEAPSSSRSTVTSPRSGRTTARRSTSLLP